MNGPDAVVVSGAEADVERVAALAAERGWKTSRLRTSHAFHSRLMEPMLAEFAEVVRGADLRRAAAGRGLHGDRRAGEPRRVDRPGLLGRAGPPAGPVRRRGPACAQGVGPRPGAGPGRRAHRAGPATLDAGAARRAARCAADRAEVATLLTAVGQLFVAGQTSTGPPSFGGPAPRPSTCPPTRSSTSGSGRRPRTGDAATRRPRPRPRPATRCSARRSTLAGRRRRCCSPGGSRRAPSPGWPTTPSRPTPSCPGTALVELALAAGERAGAPGRSTSCCCRPR